MITTNKKKNILSSGVHMFPKSFNLPNYPRETEALGRLSKFLNITLAHESETGLQPVFIPLRPEALMWIVIIYNIFYNTIYCTLF